jgi:hypothetical protein
MTIRRQQHGTATEFGRPTYQRSEAYFSDDAAGTASVQQFFRSGDPFTVDTQEIDPLGFDGVSSTTTATNAFDWGLFTEVRSVTATATMSFTPSSGPRTVTLAGEFSLDYAQSVALHPIHGSTSDSATAYTQVDFDLARSASLSASWSCDRQFREPQNSQQGSIALYHHGAPRTSVVFGSTLTPSACSFSGTVPAGRYSLFVDTKLLLHIDLPYDQGAYSESASYSLAFTFP